MSRFADDLRNFTAKMHTQNAAVFTGVVEEATRSIVDGSEITGAPGQPVDTGRLKNSWQTTYPTATSAEIATDTPYAPYIEDGGNSYGPFTLRSEVGGFHSVRLTQAGFARIVDVVTARVSSGGAGSDTSGALNPITSATGYDGEDGG